MKKITKNRKGFYEDRNAFVFLNCSLITEYVRGDLSLHIQILY